MNLKNQPRRLNSVQGGLLLVALGAGLYLTKALLAAPPHAALSAYRAVPIGFHRAAAAPDDTNDMPGPPVVIEIDATQTALQDPNALRQLCDKLTAATGLASPSLGPTGSDAPNASPASETPSDWYRWARLGSARATCLQPVPALESALRVYAVHSDEGATVCLVNTSDQKIHTRLQLRLLRGVYKIEKLTFTPQTSRQEGVATVAATDPAPCRAVLTCLQGADQAATGALVKPGWLEPGQVCLIRATDEARAARVAMLETRERLHEMAPSTPGPAKRLRRILEEGNGYLGGVTAGAGATRERRLGCIHRLILLNAQAQSLHRNFQARQSVNAAPGGAVMGALERLTDALAETSAVLTGLTPQIECAPGAAPTGQAVKTEAPTGATTTTPHEAVVTISLANTGTHTVESVKLGLDVSALPEGVTCEPDDPAYFGAVHPGQSVRATFRLRYPTLNGLPANRCVGDVSYFTAGAPAHLRPRPW